MIRLCGHIGEISGLPCIRTEGHNQEHHRYTRSKDTSTVRITCRELKGEVVCNRVFTRLQAIWNHQLDSHSIPFPRCEYTDEVRGQCLRTPGHTEKTRHSFEKKAVDDSIS